VNSDEKRNMLYLVRRWRICVDSICMAELAELTDLQVDAFVDELLEVGNELGRMMDEATANAT
jgi:hypothetical protein